MGEGDPGGSTSQEFRTPGSPFSRVLEPEMIHGQALRRREVEAAERHMPRPGFIEASVDELVLHWFDIEDVPRLIVDPALTLKWLNVRAERELHRRRDVLGRGDLRMTCNTADRQSVVQRKSGSGRVDLGGHSIIKNRNNIEQKTQKKQQ